MPDPSAIWTRGEEKHTDWGGRPLSKNDLTPHYFNDIVLARALEQASTNGWVVKTNPYEGGSDHVPFLSAGIPGLLLWHFTDQFYHTDRDRIEMVSADELKNVGVTALVTALALVTSDGELARGLIEEVRLAALDRLEVETRLSLATLGQGSTLKEERDILQTWTSWYIDALSAMEDIEVGGSSDETKGSIDRARKDISGALTVKLSELESD
jgi:aminopeptidase YwaD